LVVVIQQLYLNIEFGMRRRGQNLSFDFRGTRAGFGIKETFIIDYHASMSYQRAFLAGLSNTIKVALFGVLLASIIGLVMGVARLSSNWLLRKIAQVYVEVLRNTPVVIQMIFWYVGIILALPAIGGGFHIPGGGFLSNRGMAVTMIRGGEGFGVWIWFFIAGLVAAFFVRRWRTRLHETSGEPHYRKLWMLGMVVLFGGIGLLVTGDGLLIDVPSVGERGFGYEGGTHFSGEFAAVLFGLTIYTSAFIAEIIRGSILAVSKGQKEAAEALGFTPGQQLRLVVLPQALRVAIPPLNSQFLNLTKNSSLAIVIGFPDMMAVSRTIMNQSGRTFQMFLMVIATYLIMSLLISTVMNLVNRSLTMKGER
jgi:general L-amino acid transport system permease protein